MQKLILTNVAIIRPILIVLLAFYHAFAIYSGGWEPIEGFPNLKVYWWFDKLSYAFMLETFVFVSGYVFGFQVRTKGKEKLEAKNLLWGKFRRLLIPSMVFSLLYIVLLKDISQPLGKTAYDVINGVAHMWFLPMLFWCFIAIWVIEKSKTRPSFVLPLLMMCSLCSFLSLPLQLGAALYYMFFFYVGYILQRKNINVDRLINPSYAIVLAIAFIIFFPTLTMFCNNSVFSEAYSDMFLFPKLLRCVLPIFAKIVYSSIGLAMLFVVVGIVEKKITVSLPQWTISVGGLCMGVYLFQQFILKGLYDHTNLPVILGPYWLPWVGFTITLIVSIGLSYVLRLTRTGRFLIG